MVPECERPGGHRQQDDDEACNAEALANVRRGFKDFHHIAVVVKKEDAPKTVAADSEEFQKLYGGGSPTVLPVSLPGKDEATTCRLLQRLFAEKNKPLVFLPPVKTAAELKEDSDADADMVPVSGLEFVSAMFPPGNPALYKGHRCIVHRIFERPDGSVLADVYGPAGPFLGVDASLLTAVK